eukprot:1082050_1
MSIQNEKTFVHTILVARENAADWIVWGKALFKKHKNEIHDIPHSDDILLKRLSKSTHRWNLNESTTFGEIRTNLGNYYNINPLNIEIWVPTLTKNCDALAWDFGSKGRGFWDETIDDMYKGPILYSNGQKWLFLKFEIVAYNVKVFDQITAYHNSTEKHPKHKCHQLALFNIAFHAPNQNKADPLAHITVIYKKDWTAKQLISKILKYVQNNPVYGYVYFGSILRYINDDCMDLSLLTSMKSHHILLSEFESNKNPPNVYRR